jgi:hypothetical protein
MPSLRRLLIGLMLPALILTAFAVSSVAAGGNAGKADLCHNAGGHKWVEINVSVNALPAHFGHGDVEPDEYGDCP